MANDYYQDSGSPGTSTPGQSSVMRAEFAAIEAGFDKLPALSGNANKAVVVNGVGTALTVTAAALTLAIALTTAGSGSITLTAGGATNVTLPTSGTLATLAGSENLTNKTLIAPVLSGTATGTYTLGGTPTLVAATMSGASYTWSGNPTHSGDHTFSGHLSAPITQNSQSGAYTTVLSDANRHVLHPSSDNVARTFTIAANASVAYPIGTAITFVNEINTVTIAINSDTLTLAGSGATGSRSLLANGIATALKVASTKWVISGTGLT